MAIKQVVALPNLGKGFEIDVGASKINVRPSTDVGNTVKYGTDNLLYSPSVAAALPVPDVKLARLQNDPLTNPNSTSFILSSEGDKIFVERLPFFVGTELPQNILTPQADLRLELLIYSMTARRGKARIHGFRHPTHEGGTSVTGAAPVATILPTSRFRGGERMSSASRPTTEWSVTSNTQRFYIDTLAQWLVRFSAFYRDSAGGASSVSMYRQTRTRGYGAGKGFGYVKNMAGSLFAFRFSVADPADPRNRVTGPMTDPFMFATSIHPMTENPAQSAVYSRTVNDLNPRFAPDKYNTWMGARLPGF